MDKNWVTGVVSGMTPDEVVIYDLYRVQSLPRDELPYTEVFDQMVRDFQTQAPSPHASHHDVWRLLSGVTKAGMENIRAYLGR